MASGRGGCEHPAGLVLACQGTAPTGDNLFKLWLSSVGRGAGLNLNIPPDRRGLIPAADVVELNASVAWSRRSPLWTWRRGEERANLLRSPTAVAIHGGPLEEPAEIVIELGQRADLGGLRIEEAIAFGQRVEAFAVDVRRGWIEVARGTTIGAQRILDLSPASGDAVRIRILASQAPPVLSRVMIYAA